MIGRAESNLTREERERLKELRRQLDAEVVKNERFGDWRELEAERLGVPCLVTEVRCYTCNGVLVPNEAGLYNHIEATTCRYPVVSVSEVAS